jgi:hypothetical protein
LFGSSSATVNNPAISGLDKNVWCLSHERCNLNKNLLKTAKLTHFETGKTAAVCGARLFGSSSATVNNPAISGLDKNVLCLSHERFNLNKNLFKAAKSTHFETDKTEAGRGVGSLGRGSTTESGPTKS